MNSFRAMNTEFHTYGLTEAVNLQAKQWFQSVEAALSRFQPDSSLMQLNRSPGIPFAVPPILLDVLIDAEKYYRETEGLFNPFLGHILAAAGYRESFEFMGTEPIPQAVQPMQPAQQPFNLLEPKLRVNVQQSSVILSSGCAVDLGGIAKGWSAEKFADKLIQEGIDHGAIDAGGDIIVWGKTMRLIEIADPFLPDENIAAIRVGNTAGIATSSCMKRRWTTTEGSEMHHILDPRKLLPSTSDLVQVTAVCPSLTQAEIVAKCLLILGFEEGTSWIKRYNPRCAALGVTTDGSIVTFGNPDVITYSKGGGKYAGLA